MSGGSLLHPPPPPMHSHVFTVRYFCTFFLQHGRFRNIKVGKILVCVSVLLAVLKVVGSVCKVICFFKCLFRGTLACSLYSFYVLDQFSQLFLSLHWLITAVEGEAGTFPAFGNLKQDKTTWINMLIIVHADHSWFIFVCKHHTAGM